MAILYKVQTGAYKHAAGAALAAARVRKSVEKYLKKAGSKEKVSVAVISSGGWYKVQTGAFSSKTNAETRKGLLRKAGVYAVVVETKTQDAPAPAPVQKTIGPDKVYTLMLPYIDSKTAHEDFVRGYNAFIDEYNKAIKASHSKIDSSDAWCTEFVELMFYKAGYLNLIGYGKRAKNLYENAKKLGTWKSGTSDIKYGDVVIYQDNNGEPNHTEFALGPNDFISGNYNGGVHKRHRGSLSTVKGRIRPMYPVGKQEETSPAEPAKPHRIRIAPLAFFDVGSETSQYGDCTAIIEYGDDDKTVEHAILVDTAMAKSSANIVRKLKALGVKKLDAIVISHAHGDHYGGLTALVKAFPVVTLYLPDCTELDKYQRKYGDALRRQAKKVNYSRFMKAGSSFQIGHIHCDCLFICPAKALPEHDTHHFVNNESMALMFTIDGKIRFFTAGDLSNDGNKVLVRQIKNLRAHIFKFQWHGDRNAITHALMQAIRPLICFSNYHHKERSGRGSTRKVAEAVGAFVARNWENGDIYIDCLGDTITVTCSKGNICKTFKVE